MIIYSCIPILSLYAAWRIQKFWLLLVINFIIGVALAFVNRPLARVGGPYDGIILAEVAQILVAVFLVRKFSTEYNERRIAEHNEALREQGTPIGLPLVGTGKVDAIPRGVKLVAYYSIGIGILQLLVAGILTGFPQLSSMPFYFLDNPAVFAAAGAFSLAIAYGLFKRKKWGWKLGVIGMYISLGVSIIDIVLRPSLPSYIESVVSLGLNILMIYYICRPHVKSYFGVVSNNPLTR